MKKVLVLILLLLLVPISESNANGAGLPQFFKINGKFPDTNPLQVYGITSQSFLLPQDIAPENYLINEPIHFEVDTEPLKTVIPEPLLGKTTYTWDFGDGAKGEGLQNTHTYTDIGSYILILTINVYTDESQPPTQFVDSFLLHIIPYLDYKDFPSAIIKIDDKLANTDPKYNLIHLNFDNPVKFDASASKAPSSKVTAYFWNFGDGQSSTNIEVSHKYEPRDFATAVLRVKDSEGFISDSFVGLKSKPKTESTSSSNFDIYSLLIIITIISALSLILFSKLKKTKSQK